MDKVLRVTRLSTRGEIVRLANVLIVMLVTVCIILIFLAMGGTYFPLSGFIIAILCLANSLYMEKTGNTHVGGWILVGILILGQIGVGYVTSGFAGPVIYATPIIPVMAIILVDTRAGWIAFILTSLVLLTLYLLQLGGTLPDYPLSEGGILLGRVLALLFTGLVSTWVTWEFAGSAIKLTKKSEQQANTDHLTQLANRRYIDEVLQREIGRAQRVNSWFSLIMLDVDDFKPYNDTNGHQAGDDCLVEIARLIKSATGRSTDLAGRFGGEEFIILLPDTDAIGAMHVAQDIRQALADNQEAVCTELTPRVTMTLGVVTASGNAIETDAQLVQIADEALYEGKNQSRDCIVSKVLGGQNKSA